MPTYPVIHKETKETKEISMTMKEYEQWRKDNPDWDKDWNAGAGYVGEVGDFQDKLRVRHPGWNEVLARAGKMPGANVKPY